MRSVGLALDERGGLNTLAEDPPVGGVCNAGSSRGFLGMEYERTGRSSSVVTTECGTTAPWVVVGGGVVVADTAHGRLLAGSVWGSDGAPFERTIDSLDDDDDNGGWTASIRPSRIYVVEPLIRGGCPVKASRAFW